jgi:hypothetical protein
MFGAGAYTASAGEEQRLAPDLRGGGIGVEHGDCRQPVTAGLAGPRVDQVVHVVTCQPPGADADRRGRDRGVLHLQHRDRPRGVSRVLDPDSPGVPVGRDAAAQAVAAGLDEEAGRTLEMCRRPPDRESLADAAEVDRHRADTYLEGVAAERRLPPRERLSWHERGRIPQ